MVVDHYSTSISPAAKKKKIMKRRLGSLTSCQYYFIINFSFMCVREMRFVP